MISNTTSLMGNNSRLPKGIPIYGSYLSETPWIVFLNDGISIIWGSVY